MRWVGCRVSLLPFDFAYEGFLKEVEPLDACGSILTNLSDSIALAIRGGSPKCSFAEKVMHVSTYPHSHL